MVFKPNYNFQKAERQRLKQARKEEKTREKEQRKAETVASDAPRQDGNEVSGEQPATS